MHNPRIPHVETTTKVLRYIRSSLDFNILYKKDYSTSMLGYTNADWGNCKVNEKLITR